MSTFLPTGAAQTYVVPGGVTTLVAECWGANGGGPQAAKGGYAKGIIPVTPGETLNVYVAGSYSGAVSGGAGGTAGALTGAGAGYAGGGASDVRRGGTGLANIVVIGAGGGGNGGDGHNTVAFPGTAGGQGSPGSGTASVGGAGTNGGSGGGGGGGGGGGAAGGSGGAAGGSIAGNANRGSSGSPGLSWVEGTALSASYVAGAGGGAQVVLTPYVPPAPTLNSPASNSSLPSGTAVTVAWTYSADFAATQTGWQMRRKLGAGAYGYWNGTDFSSATAVTNTGSVSSAATGVWASGTYSWSIATVDSYGVSAFASDLLVTITAPPTVVVNGPTGTATTNPAATVTWTPTVTGSEIAWEVIIYNATEYGAGGFAAGTGPNIWDSGVQAGAATTATSPSLANDTYRAYVRVQQTGGQWSVWAFSGFIINVTPPATPTLSATVDAVNARTTLALGALVVGGTYSVQSSDDVGVTWQAVRGATAVTIAGTTATVYDYEAPAGTRRYRAQQYTATFVVPSLWSTTASAVTVTSYWLKDPLNAALNIALTYMTGADDKRTPVVEQVAVKYAWGRQMAVLVADTTLNGRQGTLTIRTLTDTDYNALLALLKEQRVLLFQYPQSVSGGQFYLRRTGNADAPFMDVANVGSPFRETTFSYVEQSAP